MMKNIGIRISAIVLAIWLSMGCSMPVQAKLLEDSMPVQAKLLEDSMPVQAELSEESIPAQAELSEESMAVQAELSEESILAQAELSEESILAQAELSEESIPAQAELSEESIPAQAGALEITSPAAILIEASTGKVIFEQNADERRSPASITKIMTLLITFDYLANGKVKLEDDVITSEYASSMGGSQVFLAQGEVQSLKTMIKCITVASGNDASVAVAEHIAGSEEAFVNLMNARAAELGMENTHFEDCCGLTDSDNHYTTARDVAAMSRELIVNHPEIYEYTQIWMEDITHVTKQGSSLFTLSSTNKLLKQYPYATGLKTGSTSKAKFCLSATARKDGMDMVAVVLGAEQGKVRFSEAQSMLAYGFTVCDLYTDEHPEPLADLSVDGGVKEFVPLVYEGEFRYLDMQGNNLDQVQKFVELPELVPAPIQCGDVAGKAVYTLDGKELGSINILYGESVEKADFGDYFSKILQYFLL